MAHQRAGKKISSDVKQNIIMFGGLVFCIIFFQYLHRCMDKASGIRKNYQHLFLT